MSSRLVLIASSVVLGLAGLGAVFVPQELLAALGVGAEPPLPVLAQLMGALYTALALANWTAKDSRFGGVYNRPLALGNLAHWFVGALVLLRAQFGASAALPLTVALVIYAVFAALFGWLIFRATGLERHEADQ